MAKSKASKAHTTTNSRHRHPEPHPQTPLKQGSRASHGKKKKAKDVPETSSDNGIPLTPKTPGGPPGPSDEQGYCDECTCHVCQEKRGNGCSQCLCEECKLVIDDQVDMEESTGYCRDCECGSCLLVRNTPGRCVNCTSKNCECHSGIRDGERYKPSFRKDTVDVETTPGGRTANPASQEQKDKAKSAALKAVPEYQFPPETDACCLITLLNGPDIGLESCHIAPHQLQVSNSAFANDNTSKLEYSWGVPYNELNLHSHYNILILDSSMHTTFDNNLWALVPADGDIIRSMSRKIFNEDNPIDNLYKPKQVFKYFLLPFPGMRKRPITRCNSENLLESPSDDNPATVHYYPYNQFPIIKSHVRPHFVVYDFGKKMQLHNLDNDWVINQLEGRKGYKGQAKIAYESLQLYKKWMGNSLPSNFKGPIRANDAGGSTNDGKSRSQATRRSGLRSSSRLAKSRNPDEAAR